MEAPSDFIGGGYLLDVNRRWAHPLGFEFYVAQRDGARVVLGLRDYRGREEEPVFGEALPANAAEKLARVDRRRAVRSTIRRERLGAVLEPIPGRSPLSDGICLRSLAEPDREWVRLLSEVGHGIAEAIEDLERRLDAPVPDDLREWLSTSAPPIFCRVISRHLLALVVSQDGEGWIDPDWAGRTNDEEDARVAKADLFAQLRSACRAVLEPQARDDTEVYRQLQKLGIGASHAELYEDEVAELRALEKELADLQVALRNGQSIGDRLTHVRDRIWELYGLAQPGMRYWRGDIEARGRFEDRKEAFLEAVEIALQVRGDYQRFLLGEIGAADLADPRAVRARLEEEREAVEEKLSELTAEREAQLSRYERLSGCLTSLQTEAAG